jgi:hypothetical protein
MNMPKRLRNNVVIPMQYRFNPPFDKLGVAFPDHIKQILFVCPAFPGKETFGRRGAFEKDGRE